MKEKNDEEKENPFVVRCGRLCYRRGGECTIKAVGTDARVWRPGDSEVVYKKYEQLIHNGRTDILELLADHELAFHMTNHSVHPIPSEYLDRMGFAQGLWNLSVGKGRDLRG